MVILFQNVKRNNQGDIMVERVSTPIPQGWGWEAGRLGGEEDGLQGGGRSDGGWGKAGVGVGWWGGGLGGRLSLGGGGLPEGVSIIPFLLE